MNKAKKVLLNVETKEKIKICLWASSQEWNVGVNNYGTEEENMFKLADVVEGLLNKYNLFDIKRNETFMGLRDNVKQEHQFKPDIVVEFHSNAGGGKGTEVFCNTKNDEGLELAQFLYNYISPISPGKDRGIKDGMHLYGIKNTYATACLIEFFFHDNVEEVLHFQKYGLMEYAVAVEKGICEFYEIPFRVYLQETPKTIKDELIDLQSKLKNIIERM